jgi:hypothetical protein
MTAVSNTSPLILLDKVGHLPLLERLFHNVIIPPAVDTEWLRPGGYSIPSWLSVEPLNPDAQKTADDVSAKIDRGEAEAIALCTVKKADRRLRSSSARARMELRKRRGPIIVAPRSCRRTRK